MKHFVCKDCGNLIAMINDSGKRVVCCKRDMDELVPKYTDDIKEKHKPTVKRDGEKVTVSIGTEDNRHPGLPEHGILWVCLVTDKGTQRKMLSPGEVGDIIFFIENDEKVIKAFAYCNLYGLWVAHVDEK